MADRTLVDRVIKELTDGWDNPNFGKNLRDLSLLRELEALKSGLKPLFKEELGKAEERRREEIDAIVAREREILDVVMNVAGLVVYNAVDGLMKGKNLRTTPYKEVAPYAMLPEDGLVEVGVVVSVYTGHKTQKGQIISDHKLLSKEVLGELRTVVLNGFDPSKGLYLKRKGKPESALFMDPVGNPKWGIIHPTHRVQATYAFQISKPAAVEIYTQHMQNK